MPEPIEVFTVELQRPVWLRPGGVDERVWADTFTGRYHIPRSRVGTPASILDLGANIGLVAAHYQVLWPQAFIVCVEMDSESAALARLNAPGITVIECAVSASRGHGCYDADEDADSYVFRPGETGGIDVAGYPLSEIIVEHCGGYVDFVKMDVEGEEWRLLADPEWAPLVGNLLVELHGKGGGELARGIELLEQAGYQAEGQAPHPQSVFAWR